MVAMNAPTRSLRIVVEGEVPDRENLVKLIESRGHVVINLFDTTIVNTHRNPDDPATGVPGLHMTIDVVLMFVKAEPWRENRFGAISFVHEKLGHAVWEVLITHDPRRISITSDEGDIETRKLMMELIRVFGGLPSRSHVPNDASITERFAGTLPAFERMIGRKLAAKEEAPTDPPNSQIGSPRTFQTPQSLPPSPFAEEISSA